MMKKILFTILVCAIVHSIAQEDDPEKNKTVPDKPKVAMEQTAICTSCHCFNITNTLQCDHLNLFEIFSADDWITLNSTGFRMEKVDFTNNNIKNITQFPQMNIKSLILRKNKIQYIANAAFKSLKYLEVLDLSDNNLETANLRSQTFEGPYEPTVYEPMKNLKVLRLSNNNLHSLDVDLFDHFPNMEELYLDLNPFRVIDHNTISAISGVPQLKVLDMNNMELSDLPNDIFHAPRALENLNLAGNLFTKIPEAIKFAVNLKTLNLDENPLTDIQGDHVFGKMEHLTSISISYTPTLKVIGKGGLSGLVALEELKINNNMRLTYIDKAALSRPGATDPDVEEWPPLKIVRLQNNNLTGLDSHFIGKWDDIVDADFVSNPWTCDCENQWLVDVLMPIVHNEVQKNNNSVLLEGVVCDSPIEMRGRHVSQLADNHEHMRCLDKYNARPERDSVILIAVLVGLLIGIPLTLGLLWIYKNGFFGICGGRGPAAYSRAFYRRAGNQDDLYI